MSNSTTSRAARYEARAAAAAAKDGDLNATPTKSTQSAPASPTSLRRSLRTKSADSNPSPHRNSADGSPRLRRSDAANSAASPSRSQADLEWGDAPAPIVTSDRYSPPKRGRPSRRVALSASVQPSGTRLETVSTTPPGLPPRTSAILLSPRINPTLDARLNACLNSLPKKLRRPNASPNTRPKKIYPHMTASGGNAPHGPPSGNEDDKDADDNEDDKDGKDDKDKGQGQQGQGQGRPGRPPLQPLGSPPPSPPPEDDDPEFDVESAVDQLVEG
ncbi:hypothetical protein B0H17DRAFT_1148880, partial [Mycena rosella]